MILINNNNVVQVSLAKVYENCIKNISVIDTFTHENTIDIVRTWLPNIAVIDVSNNETIIRLKDEKEEINLGFTGYEWMFDDYINDFYKETGGKTNDELYN